MDTDCISTAPQLTVAEALGVLRSCATLPGDTDQLPVVDAAGRYLGAVALTHLATASLDTRLEELLQRDVPRIDPYAPATEVARLFEDRDLLSAPVVNANGQLLGRIGADSVLDVIVKNAESTMRHMGGVAADDHLFARPLRSIRARTPWLASAMMGASLAALLVHRFETTIAKLAALAALSPIIASMAGASAMQTATSTIRGLARGHIASDNVRMVMRRELAIAMLSAVLLGAVVLIGVGVWVNHWWLGAAAGLALFLSFLVASAVSVFVPFTLHRLHKDPALAAGLITTTTDAVGYTLLLALAAAVLVW